eukprot:scaffold228111_cov34-Tisochrysis_lutea.AAC.2
MHTRKHTGVMNGGRRASLTPVMKAQKCDRRHRPHTSTAAASSLPEMLSCPTIKPNEHALPFLAYRAITSARLRTQTQNPLCRRSSHFWCRRARGNQDEPSNASIE